MLTPHTANSHRYHRYSDILVFSVAFFTLISIKYIFFRVSKSINMPTDLSLSSDICREELWNLCLRTLQTLWCTDRKAWNTEPVFLLICTFRPGVRSAFHSLKPEWRATIPPVRLEYCTQWKPASSIICLNSSCTSKRANEITTAHSQKCTMSISQIMENFYLISYQLIMKLLADKWSQLYEANWLIKHALHLHTLIH